MAEEFDFLIYYTAFILFVALFSGYLGIGILKDADIIPNSYVPSYNPLEILGIFIILFSTNTVPAFTFIYTLILVPYFFGLAYIVWKALPFT